jgi:hypothetical protein
MSETFKPKDIAELEKIINEEGPRVRVMPDGSCVRDTPLSFDELREANVRRCEAVFHSLDRWNELEWAGAMCGEAGEAANQAKKIRRGDANASAYKVAQEVADTIIYGDLLCARLGISLGDVVRAKFNEVSDRRQSDIKL